MLENTGLPMKLSKLGINKNDIDIIIQDGFRPEKMNTNPRTVTEDALRKILTNIL
jgi:alcohol dehydrogenase class IV